MTFPADSSSASRLFAIVLSLIVGSTLAFSAEPAVLLEETFEQPLSAGWPTVSKILDHSFA